MKKILVLAVSLVLIASVAIGGTVAFLTAYDDEANLFTTGNVKIELNENFQQGITLMPGVEVDKEVKIKNTGDQDAYVWLTLAVPTELDTLVKTTINDSEWVEDEVIAPSRTVKINDVEHKIRTALYPEKLAPGEETPVGLRKVELSKQVDCINGKWVTVSQGEAHPIGGEGSDIDLSKGIVLNVSAYAMQAEGLTDYKAAYAVFARDYVTTDGDLLANYSSNELKVVNTAEELKDALAAGNDVVLSSNIDMKTEKLAIASGQSVEINLNGKVIAGMGDKPSSSAVIENKGTLVIKDPTGKGKISGGSTMPDTDWGTEGYPTYANNTITNRDGGKLIIDGATIENVTAGGACYAIDNYGNSTLIVESGTIRHTQTGSNCAIRMNDMGTAGPCNVEIKDGEISGKRAIWIHLAGSDQNKAPEMNLKISGGKLTATNTTENLCIYSYSFGENMKNVNVEITGGILTGDLAFTGGKNKANHENVKYTAAATIDGDVYRYIDDAGNTVDIAPQP